MKTISLEELSNYTAEEKEKFYEECRNQPQPIAMLNESAHLDSDYAIHYSFLYKHEDNELYYAKNVNDGKINHHSMTLEEIYKIYTHMYNINV
ncbi:hypothetical protein CN692_14210 [Bacillus sp. AFS002410]|uniref:hypothetical protein n=1 Tax=Bacillus sp. AFS002410 TaxID=2033481 RepID=UPI000BEFB130|nr:hypothetical protein [Bacillus sp. AFS002410]PEJ57048.1 hypothetical protein CN692_14210 [Bacillus sp. AFS002410]